MQRIKRGVGERIRIGDEVEVVIDAIDGDTVSVSVNAPRDVPVHAVSTSQDKPPLAERRRRDETDESS